ncbi:hypothetical protein [Nocardiopsis rhodophaea]|uniref:hypothetical protein n=1 Tax=Nocardiopsis rhodophaea TaxID=280238 RepID=UPI0031D5AA80
MVRAAEAWADDGEPDAIADRLRCDVEAMRVEITAACAEQDLVWQERQRRRTDFGATTIELVRVNAARAALARPRAEDHPGGPVPWEPMEGAA